jgi:Cu+-exporting ATPase
VRVIRQNILLFAFGVNGLGILLTAWLWPLLAPARWFEHGPVAAVVYHQLGSLAVLLNAMRLLWFERGPASPAVARWRDAAVRVNGWLERRLDLDEGLHWLSHHWRPVSAGLAALALLAWALSGLAVVGPDEVAVVRRFGRPLPDDLGPGLHWNWPWPIDALTRVQPGRVHTVEVGFRTIGPARTSAPRTWSSPHGSDGVARLADEAVMITGDGNLLEVQGSVRYTIANPRVYLFEVAEPVTVLRSAAESVLRETVAGRPMADLLTADRSAFQREALKRLEQRCAGYGPEGLGLRLEGLSLHDLHPPQEVVRAYHDVTNAMEKRDKRVNEAEANRIASRRRQEGQSLQAVRKAEAERFARVELAKAARAEFEARYRARSALGAAQEWALARDAFAAVLHGRPPAEAGAEYLRRRGEARARREALADFRAFWDRLGTALSGRPKVLIDADQVPARRHLWLAPFTPFPPPGARLPRDPGRAKPPADAPARRDEP